MMKATAQTVAWLWRAGRRLLRVWFLALESWLWREREVSYLRLEKRIVRAVLANSIPSINETIRVPNTVRVDLHRRDFERWHALIPDMSRDVSEELIRRAKSPHYQMLPRPSVAITQSDKARLGFPIVFATFADGTDVAPNPTASTQTGTELLPSAMLRWIKPPGGVVPLVDGRLTRIGRASDCHVRIDESGIGRMHCTIRLEGITAIVEDNSSTNGTFVNDARVDRRGVLKEGDLLRVGMEVAFRFEFHRSDR
jgi:hypothetical protein